MGRLRRRLGPAWLLLLLALPGVLWLAGARQRHIEGKPFTPVPELSAKALDTEETYKTLDQVVLDRLPLRQYALRFRAQVWMKAFHTSPVADTRLGKDGFFFLAAELRACDGTMTPAADPVDAVEVTTSALRSARKRASIAMTGTKVLMESGRAPRYDAAALACQRRLEARFDAQATRLGGLDLQPGLDAIKASGRDTFLRHDTHWNDEGKLLFVKSMLDWIRPGLADDAGLRFGPYIARPADLAATMEIDLPDGDRVIEFSREAKPIEPGKVMVIGDSQTDKSMINPPGTLSMFQGPLKNQLACEFFSIIAGACDEAFRSAKVIAWQTSARHASEFVQRCGRPIAVVTERMRGEPVSWLSSGTPSGTLAAPGIDARVLVAGTEQVDRTRVLRIPVATGTGAVVSVAARTAGGRPLPCTANTQLEPGGDVIVPLPPGVPAAEALIGLDAPAGTVFGRPTLVTLER